MSHITIAVSDLERLLSELKEDNARRVCLHIVESESEEYSDFLLASSDSPYLEDAGVEYDPIDAIDGNPLL